MLYPILFEPIYKEMVWGGNRLGSLFGRTPPFSHAGESWDISCRPGEMGIVKNGAYKGLSFAKLLDQDRVGWLGKNLADIEKFPLLVKLIDAENDLSIQVHPDDALAQASEQEQNGKTEMWYILNPPRDGFIILGLRDRVTAEMLRQAAVDGRMEACMNKLAVSKGDVINIPAGLIHALTGGIMVAEIQQNSDLTYRVYDYDRPGLDGKPRELHIEKSLAAADFENKLSKERVTGLPVRREDALLTYYIAGEYFAMVKYEVSGSFADSTDELKFHIFTCVEGEGRLSGDWGQTCFAVGDSILVPAGLGGYTIEGTDCCTLLKSWVPDIEEDFVKPLAGAGYAMDEIKLKTAIF